MLFYSLYYLTERIRLVLGYVQKSINSYRKESLNNTMLLGEK